jgi:alkaline phosphatase
MKVGIISSAAPNHATPAGFYAHAKSRNMYPEIAMQLAASALDYVGGPPVLGAEGTDDKATDAKAREAALQNGYTVVEDRKSFDALKPGVQRIWVRSAMPLAIDGKHEIPLADHVSKAIELLAGPEGFFMMVEGAAIDWASHSNDGAAMVQELLEFDRAIARAIEFYRARPDEVLIVVTADHECGGLSLIEGRLTAPGMSKILDGQKKSRNASVDMFETFEKEKISFDEALPQMKAFFGIQYLSDEELAECRKIFKKGGGAQGQYAYGDERRISLFWSRLVSARAGLIWGSLNHTADPVPVYAVGAQAARFAGNSDNALIGRYIRDLISERKK